MDGLTPLPDSSSTTFGDLSLALKASLHQTPVYPALLSSLRSTLLTLLAPPSSSAAAIGASIQRSGPPDNALINTLIEEYLAFNGFGNSRTVFRAECGMDVYEDEGLPTPVDGGAESGVVPRRAVELDLGLETKDETAARLQTEINGAEIPLIYSLVQRVRETARGAEVGGVEANASVAARTSKKQQGVGGGASGRGELKAAGSGNKQTTVVTERAAVNGERGNWDGLGGSDRRMNGATLKRNDAPGGIFLER